MKFTKALDRLRRTFGNLAVSSFGCVHHGARNRSRDIKEGLEEVMTEEVMTEEVMTEEVRTEVVMTEALPVTSDMVNMVVDMQDETTENLIETNLDSQQFCEEMSS